MDQPLDEIEYLSRSENRVRMLELLARDALTRRELQDELGASQATLSRILPDFESRQWIRKRDAVYETTLSARGSLIVCVHSNGLPA